MNLKRRPTEAAAATTRTNSALGSPASCRVTPAANQRRELAPEKERFSGSEQISEPTGSSAARRRSAACGENAGRSESVGEACRSANWPLQMMSERLGRAPQQARAHFQCSRRVYLSDDVNEEPKSELPHATQSRVAARTWKGQQEAPTIKQVAVLMAVCLISGWPTHRTATASIADDQGGGDNQLERQLIDIHRRIHILNRITQLAGAGKHRQQLADAGLWDGPPAQQADPPQLPMHPTSGAGNKVAPGQQIIASGAIKHLNSNQLEEWPRGGDMIRALAMQHINQQKQQQEQEQQQQHQQAQHDDLHRQQSLKFTTPTLNRQLSRPSQQVAVPTAGYELGPAPTDALQLVLRPDAPAVSSLVQQFAHQREPPGRSAPEDWQIAPSSAQIEPAESIARPMLWRPPPTSTTSSTTGRPRDSRAMFESEAAASKPAGAKMAAETSQEAGELAASQTAEAGKSAEASGDADNQERSRLSQLRAEPRQKRRIFNRILKKAEWNHLFLELSKVFLRYFLDLALKDIIGKQSGSTSSDSSTSGRKKLEVQSELTDMLKEFIKTAITNI